MGNLASRTQAPATLTDDNGNKWLIMASFDHQRQEWIYVLQPREDV